MRPLHRWAFGLVCLVNLAVALAQQEPLQFVSVPLRLAACQPVQWDWRGGTPPYSMFYQVTSEVNNTDIKMVFTGVYATTFTWPEVMLEPDWRVTIILLDGTFTWIAGTNATNSKTYETMVFGNDRSCLDRIQDVVRPPPLNPEPSPSIMATSTLPAPFSAESSSIPSPGSSGEAAGHSPTPSEDGSDSAATSSEAPETAPAKKKSNAGAIAGGVVGGSLGIAIIAAAVLIWLRRQRIDKLRPSSPFDIGVGEGSYPEPTPFEPPQTSQVRLATPLATPLPTTTTTSPATSPMPFAMPAFTEKQRFTSAIPPPVRSLSATSSDWASSSNVAQTFSERTSDVFTRPSSATNHWATTSETGTDHAADAGRLPSSPELPPMYNPAWRESDDPRE